MTTIFDRALPLESYTVHIVPEDPVALHDGKERHPEIDYVVCLDDNTGAPLCRGIKKKPCERQLPQLSAYASKVSTCRLYSQRVLVSLFITPTEFAVGFSALMDTKGHALPTTYFVPWRDTKRPLVVHSDAILLLSFLHALKVKRRLVEEPEPILLLQVANKLYQTPYSPPAPTSVAGQTLNDVVRELRRKDKEIAEVKNEVQRLQEAVQDFSEVREQVDVLTKIVSPPRPPSRGRGCRRKISIPSGDMLGGDPPFSLPKRHSQSLSV